ncbi:MAG TPA: serine protease [Ktedonobacterales bacterium]
MFSRSRAWAGARGLAATLALAVSLVALSSPASAGPRPPGGALADPVVRAVDVAEPAVVRIATLYQGTITLRLCGVSVTLPEAGLPYTVGALGSGAFISAHGDVLTAEHVVDVPPQDLEQAIFQNSRAAADIAAVVNSAPCLRLTAPLTPDDVTAGALPALGIATATQFGDPSIQVWRGTGFMGVSAAGPDSNSLSQALFDAPHQTASVEVSSVFQQDDVAILHVGLDDTPSIQLDQATSVAPQDHLTIIGFPGNGDLDPLLGGGLSDNLLTPSVNIVNVSAIKHNRNGSLLIQVGGNVEHGDSGGPALDSEGRIVGIVSFGGPDSRGETAFLRSSDSVQALITRGSLDTRPGQFQQKWAHAFGVYAASYAGHWHAAAAELDALAGQYPDFQAIGPYRVFADTAASHETATTATQVLSLPILLAAAGVVVVVLVVLSIVAVARARSRRKARQRAVAEAATPPTPAVPV